MGAALSDPLTIYLAATVAVACALVEVALPTVGVAGTVSLLAGLAAAIGLQEGGYESWPFAFIAFALVVWAVLLLARRMSVPWHAVALVAFGGGSVLFGSLAGNAGTMLAGALATAGAAGGIPSLHRQMAALLDRPSKIGTDSLAGRRVVVLDWGVGSGTVDIDGARWRALLPGSVLSPGDTAVVDHVDGLSVYLERVE